MRRGLWGQPWPKRVLFTLGLCLCLIVQPALAADSDEQASTEALLWQSIVAATLTLFVVTNPLEMDRVILEMGEGNDVALVRLGMQHEWKNNLLQFWGNTLHLYWQADYAKWQSNLDSKQTGANNSFGVVPMFRFTRPIGSAMAYLDMGVGAYAVSTSKINDRNLGTNFQFGDQLTFGGMWGVRQQWGVGYRYWHLSNNSLQLPNNGINFHLLSLTYRY